MRLRIFLIILLMSFYSLTISRVFAAEDVNVISSQQAAEIVETRYGGKVLKVKKQNDNNNYKVKVVTANGEVLSKVVNGKTGTIEGNY